MKTRNIRLFQFYNDVGEKYPGSQLIYKSGVAKAREKCLRKILSGRKSRALTLDVGCGNGHFKPYIKNYVGLDPARGYLKRFNGQRIRGVAQYLPFANEVFDRVLISEVLEHIWERKTALDECHRVLKHRGILIISVPYGQQPFRIQRNLTLLEKYGVKYCTYVHGQFNVNYTRKLLIQSKFRIYRMTKIHNKGKTRYLVAIAKKRR